MKKFFLALALFCAWVNVEAQSQTGGKRVLVAYFSKTGTTQTIAKYIHEKAGGDIFEIVPVNPYPEGYQRTVDIARAELEQNARPSLTGSVPNVAAYDIVFVGYPIWFGSEPMVIRTFLDACNLSGKTIIPFCTSGRAGIEISIRSIRSLAKGATVLDGNRFSGRPDVKAVNKWVDTAIASAAKPR